MLDDLSHLSGEQILGRARQRAELAAVLVLLALRFGRDLAEFFQQIMQWSEFLTQVVHSDPGADAFRSVVDHLEGAPVSSPSGNACTSSRRYSPEAAPFR
jgi:hypothetical protein